MSGDGPGRPIDVVGAEPQSEWAPGGQPDWTPRPTPQHPSPYGPAPAGTATAAEAPQAWVAAAPAWVAAPEPVREPGRLSLPGLAVAVLGFVAVLYAQIAPWGHVAPRGETPGVTIQELNLEQLGSTQTVFYSLGWMLLLALVAVVLVAGPPLRRIVSAAAVGIAAGQLALLVGILQTIDRVGAETLGRGSDIANLIRVTPGAGLYAAFAGVVLLATSVAAAQLTGRYQRATPVGRYEADEPGQPGAPADLSVTPATPGSYGISR
jgi:hypothetical protein